MSVALITHCSAPIGQSIAYEVATAGHTVYAGIPAMTGENARRAEELALLATDCRLEINPIELDTVDPISTDLAARTIGWLDGRLDAVIHAPTGGAEDEFEIAPPPRIDPDADIQGQLQVNRACLPLMHASGGGYLIYAGDAQPIDGYGVHLGHEVVQLLSLPVARWAYRSCI